MQAGLTDRQAPGVAPEVPILAVGQVYAVRRFRAMNTDVEVRALGVTDGALLSGVERTFADVERRFSRFLGESELIALNRADGRPVLVSAEMFDLLSVAQALHRETGGVFNPLVLPALEATGYDRSFELVDRAGAAVDLRRYETESFADVTLDPRTMSVSRPPRTRIDLGGIGKGWAVDRAAALMRAVGHVQINAGGDMAAVGRCGDGGGWPASIVHPLTGADICELRLNDEALATSTTSVRAWKRGSRRLHHIIDPRTGTSAQSEVIAASVIAPTATQADVYAKSALILGVVEGRRLLESRGCQGLFVLDDGHIVATSHWRAG